MTSQNLTKHKLAHHMLGVFYWTNSHMCFYTLLLLSQMCWLWPNVKCG